MDFKLTKQSISVNEVIYDGSAEQSVEIDYILPDYYPDIFKILKCQVSPKVISAKCSGNKLLIDTAVFIKVIYITNDSSTVEIVDQKYTYSKSIDLPKEPCDSTIRVTAKNEYINCRAVNERRLDIRGAVSSRIIVEDSTYQDILKSADGCGIQLKPDMKKCVVSKSRVSKHFTVREEIDLSEIDALSSIIKTTDCMDGVDAKIIANKIIYKSKIKSEVLYKKENGEISELKFDIPVSQIIDFNGISEDDKCGFETKILMAEMTPVKSVNGENKTLSCEYLIFVSCEACCEEEVTIISDAYSTMYETENNTVLAKLENTPVSIDETFTQSIKLNTSENYSKILGSWSETVDVATKIIDNKLKIFGNLCVMILAEGVEGCVIFTEKSEPFEYELLSDVSNDLIVVCSQADVLKTKASSVSENEIEAEITIESKAVIKSISMENVIKDITLKEDCPKTKTDNFALKIYYAQPNEDIWGIAKKYNTNIKSIMDENENIEESFSKRTMLLIPITE